MAGKGDTPRPVDPKKWAENWDRICAPKPQSRLSGMFSPKDHVAYVSRHDVSNARVRLR